MLISAAAARGARRGGRARRPRVGIFILFFLYRPDRRAYTAQNPIPGRQATTPFT
jgi:hypothetical protein